MLTAGVSDKSAHHHHGADSDGVRIDCWRKFRVDFTLYKRTLLMFQGKAYGQILSDFVLTGLPTLEEMKES